MPNLDDAFFPELRVWAAKMQANPADVLAVLYGESGLNPMSPGHVAAYEGINQMNQPYLRAHGIDPADYLTWPASRQMREVAGPFLLDMVQRWLKKPVRSAGVLEALNLYPANVATRGDAPGSVLIDSQAASPGERAAYQANKALDQDGDGKITIADLDTWLGKRTRDAAYQRELARLGGSIVPAAAGVLVVLVAIAAAVAYAWKG